MSHFFSKNFKKVSKVIMTLKLIIKVIPSSGRSSCQIDKNGTLKCSLKSPPEKGKANEELIGLIAQKLDLSRASVGILLGKTARIKTVLIQTAKNEQEVRVLLCGGVQLSIK
jgi:uncharacterized protein (TIGR00251 family)